MSRSLDDVVRGSLGASADMAAALAADQGLQSRLQAAAQACASAILSGGKIFFAGNGGSAAEAQHLSSELVGRLIGDRRSLPALALHTDGSALTAIANDYGYEHVFSRQLEGLARPGDVLVGLSTSGRSPNVVRAMACARELGLVTIAMSGRDPRDLAPLSDHILNIPSDPVPQIQEGHLILGHLLCLLIETIVLA